MIPSPLAWRAPASPTPEARSRSLQLVVGVPIRFYSRLLIGLYFIEAGILLIYAPWTAWWARNYFADAWPWIHSVMATSTCRIVVAAAGAITVAAGMTELRRALAQRFGRGTGRPGDL
ncbi:MAG: hypothetical protein ABI634_00225 [Acidobacteriota bacterium]